MKVKATEANSYPAGVRWSVGKVREIKVAKGEKLPAWLEVVKEPKAKAKAKAKANTDEAADSAKG